MKFTIDDSLDIVAVQHDFNKMFPYLRLEILSVPNKGYSVPAQMITLSSKSLKDFRTETNTDIVTLSPDMTINQLEELFRNHYGLNVKVFRKSGKAWIETTLTNEWTLEEQNREGEALSNRN